MRPKGDADFLMIDAPPPIADWQLPSLMGSFRVLVDADETLVALHAELVKKTRASVFAKLKLATGVNLHIRGGSKNLSNVS